MAVLPSTLLCFTDHYLLDNSISNTLDEFCSPFCATKPLFYFHSQTASPKLKATPKFVGPFSYLFEISHCIIEASSDLIRVRFQYFFSKMSRFFILRHLFTDIFFHDLYFCPIFFHAQAKLILPSNTAISRFFRSPFFLA